MDRATRTNKELIDAFLGSGMDAEAIIAAYNAQEAIEFEMARLKAIAQGGLCLHDVLRVHWRLN